MILTGKCKEAFEASIEDMIKFNRLSKVSNKSFRAEIRESLRLQKGYRKFN